MTDYTDLIERLREAGDTQDGNWAIYDDAADALEAQGRRLAEAEREIALLDTAYNKEIRRRVELESLLRETSARLDLNDYGELFATIDAFLGKKP